MCTCRPATSSPTSRARPIASSVCSGGQPELRPVVRGLDRRMRVGLDARCRADKDTLHAGGGRELDLVRRVDHYEPRARPRGCLELLVALVVAVDDQPVARNTGP